MSGNYTMTDLIDHGDAYLNTGIAIECPLCGNESFYLWQIPTLVCMWGVCSSCRWAGNGAHLRSRLSDVPYSVATAEYDTRAGKKSMRRAELAPEDHQEKHEQYSRSLKSKESNPAPYRSLFSDATGNAPDTTQAMSNIIGYEGDSHSLIIPHYVTPRGGMMGSIHRALIKGDKPSISIDPLNLGEDKYREYGWLNMSDDQAHLILVTNLYDAAMVSSAYQAGGIIDTPPIVLSMAPTSPFLLERSMNVNMTLVTRRVPGPWASVLMSSESIRIFDGTPQDLVRNMDYSVNKVARQMWEGALPPKEWILSMVKNRNLGYRRLLESINDPSTLMDLVKSSEGGTRAAIKSASSLPLAPSYHKMGNSYYAKRSEGGYDIIRDPSGFPLSTIDPIEFSMDVDLHIVSDHATLQRGMWEYDGQSFRGEARSCDTNYSPRGINKQFINHGLDEAPDIPMTKGKFMSINRYVSDPKVVIGEGRSGYHPGEGLFLPGVTITSDGIEDYGRITRYNTNYLSEGEWSGELAPDRDDATRLAFCCFVAAGIQLMDMIGQWCKRPVCMMTQGRSDCDMAIAILEDKLGAGKCNGYLSISYSSSGGIQPIHGGKTETRQVRRQAKHNSLHRMDVPGVEDGCDTPDIPDIPALWYRLLWESARDRINRGTDGVRCCCDAMIESFEACLGRRGLDVDLSDYWSMIDCQKED